VRGGRIGRGAEGKGRVGKRWPEVYYRVKRKDEELTDRGGTI